jgi:rhodanese-related sulfurtransferase
MAALTRLFRCSFGSTISAVALCMTMQAWTISARFAFRQRTRTTLAFVRQLSVRNDASNLLDQNQKLLSRSIPASSNSNPTYFVPSTTRLMSTVSGGSKPPDITHVNRAQMEEIIEDYESGGREESQYCVIDVRTEEEVRSTGKISEHVYTLPVQVIMQSKVFDMDPEEFEEYCKFPKPTPDETIVFTCAAGMRSVSACHFAAQSGYTKLINYTGGANEWFSPSNF